MKRRDFLRTGAGFSAAAFFLGPQELVDSLKTTPQKLTDMYMAKNGSPVEMVRQAVGALGGMGKFVSKGDEVVVKPNIGWDRKPEQAANTHPEVVAETVKLCYEAGAKKVKVFDRTCNDARRCYRRSGIEEAVKSAGGEIRHIVDTRFKKTAIPDGKVLKSWEVYKDVLDSDVFINLPVAKHHSLTRVSLGIKNVMGVIGGNRGEIHNGIDQKLADLCTVLRPDLTIMDATRILTANGPQGGSLSDVRQTRTVIAGTDMVAVDAYTATLFELRPTDIGHIKTCHLAGLGEMDLAKIGVKEIDLG